MPRLLVAFDEPRQLPRRSRAKRVTASPALVADDAALASTVATESAKRRTSHRAVSSEFPSARCAMKITPPALASVSGT